MAKARKIRESKRRPSGFDFQAGALIRRARETADISQEELALRLGTKRTAISRIENHAEDIKLSTLGRVAKALGKDLKVKIG